MNIEIDDDFSYEIVAASLKETYISILGCIKDGGHPEDMEEWESLVTHIPPVLSYFMHIGAYEEFMQRVKEMNSND
jgi:hypothetical protein